MTPAISPFFHDTSFDPFLFAEIGEERSGMLLSVVSALARLDLDPWREAESLSRLPPAAATERLSSLLSSLPPTQLGAPAPGAVMRLIGLLPKAARTEAPAPSRAGVTTPKISRTTLVYFVAAFVIFMMCAIQYSERRDPNPAAGVSPPSGATDPGVAKTRGE